MAECFNAVKYICCCQWASTWKLAVWFFVLANLVCNVIFVGTTITLFQQLFGSQYVSADLRSIGVIIFLTPAVLTAGTLILSGLVMIDFFSEAREKFYRGALSTSAFFNIWILSTYVVYGAILCKWSANSCNGLIYASVVFAALSILSEFLFFIVFNLYLANEADYTAVPPIGGITRSAAALGSNTSV